MEGSAEKVMSKGYTGARKDVQTLMFDVANNRYEGDKKRAKCRKKSRNQTEKAGTSNDYYNK